MQFQLCARSRSPRSFAAQCLLLRKCPRSTMNFLPQVNLLQSVPVSLDRFLAFWSSPHPISNSQLHTLLYFHLCPIYLVVFKVNLLQSVPVSLDRFLAFWSSPHPISNSQLHTLLYFHLCPIYLVVFKGVYFFLYLVVFKGVYFFRMGYLILRGASRLDAFSVYPFQTWLPGRRLGSLTGAPAVRPSRSSRTKDSSSQISYAHAG